MGGMETKRKRGRSGGLLVDVDCDDVIRWMDCFDGLVSVCGVMVVAAWLLEHKRTLELRKLWQVR